MTITLTTDQQAWIDAHIASGEFATVEDAAHTLMDSAILDRALVEHDDLAWAKPFVDEALAEIDRGETISAEIHRAGVRTLLQKLKP